jgi:hypothetical protein
MKAHQKPIGDEDEWLTPPSIWKPLGPFDLDPCASIIQPWEIAPKCYTIRDDGFRQVWTGRVWCNPPFNKFKRPHWMQRMAEHGNGCLLVPAATETDAFFKCVWDHPNTKAVCFLRKRPHFCFTNGKTAVFNSGTAMVIVAYSAFDAQKLIEADLGKILHLNNTPPKEHQLSLFTPEADPQ